MDPNQVDPSELFSSPIKPSDLPSLLKTPITPRTPTPGTNTSKEKEPFDAEEVRAAALGRELEGMRNINEVLEGVIGTLERAKGNMSSVSQTVTNASTLLNTWTRILSQTEHNQRLLLDKDWAGATRDLEAIEDARRAEQAAERRRAAEAERRREDARRAVEERELRAAAATPGRARGGPRGARALRARGILRGGANTSALSSASSASAGSARGGSQIGRGVGAGRLARGARGVRGIGTGIGRGVR